MAGFEHRWDDKKLKADARRKAAKAVNGAVDDTVLLAQSPAPVGWTRVTGFLAGSTQPEYADESGDGPITARAIARANYAIYQERRQHVMERSGQSMGKTIGDRIKRQR